MERNVGSDGQSAIGSRVWRAAAEASHVPICLSDPRAVDEPLVWVNAAFTRVTGYTPDEAVGRNCRFLQGPDTDREAVARIRAALTHEQPVTETLLNHRRDGTPFWNHLSLSPLFDSGGRLVHYVGVQDDVTAEVESARALSAASQREHEAALALQTGLLPRLTQVRGLDVAATYVPSTAGVTVGGDWYDVVELPDGRVAVAVGDVMGHDLRAAAAMGQLRSMTRALAWSDPEPTRVVGRLDQLARAVLDVTFATLFYGVVTRQAGSEPARITWIRAGHPPPLLRDRSGTVTRLDDVVDPPVGVIAGRTLSQSTTELPAGCALVLYTDGLIETRERSVSEGLAALSAAVEAAPSGDSADGILARLVEALVPTHPGDDTCILVVAPLE